MVTQYFTLEQANEMIPELEIAFGRMMQLHAQIRTLYASLQGDGYAPDGDDFEVTPDGASREVVQKLASLKTLIEALRNDLLGLHERGCMVKSVESGLVDWFTHAGDRDIFLCWRLGEKAIGFWHEIEVGFDGRRPLSQIGRPPARGE